MGVIDNICTHHGLGQPGDLAYSLYNAYVDLLYTITVISIWSHGAGVDRCLQISPGMQPSLYFLTPPC